MGFVQRRPPMTASHVFPSPGLDRLAASDGCPDCPPVGDRISLAARESAMPQFAQKLSVPGRSLPHCGQNIGSPSLLARHVKRHHLEHRSKPLELLGQLLQLAVARVNQLVSLLGPLSVDPPVNQVLHASMRRCSADAR